MGSNSPLPFAAAAPTLSDLVAGGNRELLAALRALAQGKSTIASVYLWGAGGGGKSALLRATCHEAKQQALPTYFVAAASAGDILPPLGGGLLAVDDVGALDNEAQITLFDWHNRAAAGGQQQFLLASGDAAPTALPLRDELASRLAAGLVFRLQPLSDDEKSQALAAWARRHGFTLAADIAELLLTRLPRNMHALTSALAELDDFLLQQQKPLTPRRVSSWLAKRQPESPLFAPPRDSSRRAG